MNLFGYRRFLNRKVPALVQLNRKGEESSPSLCDLLAWKYQAVPTSFLIGRDGLVIRKYEGGIDWMTPAVLAEIEAAISAR